MIGIYKITNIKNNKVYIGKSINIEKRWKEHLYSLNNNKHHSAKLQNSFNKTKDKSIFVFEIIEEVIAVGSLDEREQYYIKLYDSFNNGYNCSNEDSEKYLNTKIKNKSNNVTLKCKLYDEFIRLHEKYTWFLEFNKSFYNKLLGNYYSKSTYKVVIYIINWFLDNYSSKFIGNVSAYSNKQFYLIVKNKEHDNEVACYHYKNKSMHKKS